jgi:hypothetical protein
MLIFDFHHFTPAQRLPLRERTILFMLPATRRHTPPRQHLPLVTPALPRCSPMPRASAAAVCIYAG